MTCTRLLCRVSTPSGGASVYTQSLRLVEWCVVVIRLYFVSIGLADHTEHCSLPLGNSLDRSNYLLVINPVPP